MEVEAVFINFQPWAIPCWRMNSDPRIELPQQLRMEVLFQSVGLNRSLTERSRI